MTESIEISRQFFSYADESFVLMPEQPDVLTVSDIFAEKRISPSIEEIYVPSHHDLDIKWKSVSVPYQPSPIKLAYPYGAQKSQLPQLKRYNSTGKSSSFKDRYFNAPYGAVSDIYVYPGQIEEPRAPEKPLFLVPTRFETSIPLNCITPLIERALFSFPEVSFQTISEDFMVSFN